MAEFQIDLKECLRIKKEFTAIIEELRKCEKRLYAVKDNMSKMSGYKDIISCLERECQAVTEERTDVEKLLQTFSDCVQCYETAEKNVREQEIDWHFLLDAAGLLPAVGAAFDGINTAWYAAEGDWSNALLSGLAFVPGIGEAVGGGKTGIKVGGKVIGRLEDAADIAKAAEKTGNVADTVKEAGKIAEKAGKTGKSAGELGKYVDEAIESGTNSINSLDDLLTNPNKLSGVSGEELYNYLVKNGYDVKPLNRGSFKDIPFEEGGGFKVNWGGDRILQYHPENLSHHGGAYFKISSGETGTIRIDLDGNLIN